MRHFLPGRGAAGQFVQPLDELGILHAPSALTMLSVAAIVEILAYCIPGLDNLLDTLATPAAFFAGTLVSAAVMTDVPPMVKWTAILAMSSSITARRSSARRT